MASSTYGSCVSPMACITNDKGAVGSARIASASVAVTALGCSTLPAAGEVTSGCTMPMAFGTDPYSAIRPSPVRSAVNASARAMDGSYGVSCSSTDPVVISAACPGVSVATLAPLPPRLGVVPAEEC